MARRGDRFTAVPAARGHRPTMWRVTLACGCVRVQPAGPATTPPVTGVVTHCFTHATQTTIIGREAA